MDAATSPRAPQAPLRFGACELRIPARELIVGGEPQHLEPRVFDVLAYLVQYHERVVSRDELLQHVWPSEFVSDSVVARCIMKVRRAIGDDSASAPLIKTLHRTGYRFVGAVQSADQPPAVPASIERVAVLPFVNSSGDAALVWVELGLCSVVGRTLEAQPGLSVVPVLEVLGALQHGAPSQGTVQRAALLHDVLNAAVVVAFEVRAAAGAHELHYALLRVGSMPLEGSARGAALAELAVQAAREIASRLARVDTAPQAWPFDANAFMTEVYARAMEAVEQQRFQVAVNLLQVCVDTEPHPLEAAVEYIFRLATVAHAATVERAQPVLARARAEGNTLACARVMSALSNYHFYEGNFAPSLAAIDAALALLEGEPASNVQALALLRRIELAIAARDFDVAQRLCDRLTALARQLGSDRVIGLVLRNQARIAQLCGEPERALRDIEQAVVFGRALHLHAADLAAALFRWAALCRGAGELARALPLIEESARHALDSGMSVRAAHALAMQASIAAASGRCEVAQAALAGLRTHAIVSSAGGLGLHHLAEGAQAWREHDPERALLSFERGGALVRNFENFWFEFGLVLSTGAAIAASRFDMALRFIEEYETHPMLERDRWLQAEALLMRAALAHAQGARADAWRALHAALALAPRGAVRAHAQLAAVWLACEDGALDPVPGWLSELGAWTSEHRDGIAALARYRFACGDFAAAEAAQARVVEQWPLDQVSEAQRRFLAACRAAGAAGHAVEVERLARLPAFAV